MACQAAGVAGAVLKEGFDKPHQTKPKGAIDLVTEYNLKSEETIGGLILNNFPDHRVVGEEKGLRGQPNSPWRWYVDPLDGTTNFAHSHPYLLLFHRPRPGRPLFIPSWGSRRVRF